ncbi:MAG: hypothetical protein KJ559_02785 [Nanoarchaeota archaeon]|nr:hypothetical protein [Nanoarchaeota archaeon]
MKTYIIANPPCGIYKGDLPLGYAYYQTLLDIHSRFLSVSKGLEVICPKYSLNALGKRAENLNLNGTIEDLDRYVNEWIKKGNLRDKMNFSFSGNVLDTSKESVEQTTETFRKLYEQGYSFQKEGTFYLDIKKIRENFDLEGISQDINFFSNRSRNEFTRVIKNLSEPVRITKERKYSVSNPFGGEGISPIFGVSNLFEGHFDKEIDFMASSEGELTRYLMLRFLCQVSISKSLPMKNILVYNYINPEGDFNNWEMNKLVSDGVGSDSLRYSFAKCFSLSEQKTELKNDLLKGGKKLVYLTGNLKNLFLKDGFSFGGFQKTCDEIYVKRMENFKYPQVLGDLERKLKEVSNEVNNSRDKGDFDIQRKNLFSRYLTLVNELTPFLPFISQKVINDLSIK